MSISPNEAKTRKDLIDPALVKADWNLQDPHASRYRNSRGWVRCSALERSHGLLPVRAQRRGDCRRRGEEADARSERRARAGPALHHRNRQEPELYAVRLSDQRPGNLLLGLRLRVSSPRLGGSSPSRIWSASSTFARTARRSAPRSSMRISSGGSTSRRPYAASAKPSPRADGAPFSSWPREPARRERRSRSSIFSCAPIMPAKSSFSRTGTRW